MALNVNALKKRKRELCGEQREIPFNINSDDLALSLKFKTSDEGKILVELMRLHLTNLSKSDNMALVMRALILLLEERNQDKLLL